ncbi:hypothetical protein MTO96_028325 [Rhipicephalus appendiculatus]
MSTLETKRRSRVSSPHGHINVESNCHKTSGRGGESIAGSRRPRAAQSDARVGLNCGRRRRHAHRCAAGDRRESREQRPEAGTAEAGKTTGTERRDRMLIPPLPPRARVRGERASRPLGPGMRLAAP